jgi:predicted RNA-binding protein
MDRPVEVLEVKQRAHLAELHEDGVGAQDVLGGYQVIVS